jgi:hypothetical protein
MSTITSSFFTLCSSVLLLVKLRNVSEYFLLLNSTACSILEGNIVRDGFVFCSERWEENGENHSPGNLCLTEITEYNLSREWKTKLIYLAELPRSVEGRGYSAAYVRRPWHQVTDIVRVLENFLKLPALRISRRWYLTSCSLVEVYLHFGRTCCFHLKLLTLLLTLSS